MLSACSNSVSSDDGAPMEESSQGYYSDAALIADEPGRCLTYFMPNTRDCSIYAYIQNNGRIPLDFYAEAWAEDSEGRLYKCEGRGSIFEETLNPGMKTLNRFALLIPPDVTITKIFLVDIGGPVSETILSAPVLLESSS
jgi:hypothetical protein